MGGLGIIMFNDVYRNCRVLITGHTGFKGSWLALWLQNLGAEVAGLALDPVTKPNHFSLLGMDILSFRGDVRDRKLISKIIGKVQPKIIFHLAAQPLVRKSYLEPVETFETNILGTLNLLEEVRNFSSVKAVVMVSSDKCYENHEEGRPFTENDQMGGGDPYSASKGAAELVVSSYRKSFFTPEKYGKSHNVLVASVRAGNVIGGGDWAEDRLVPDIMKAAAKGLEVVIRSPRAIRPWQHVLEPLSGYLLVGQKLYEGDISVASAWNFGPAENDHLTVSQVCSVLQREWNEIDFSIQPESGSFYEATFLRLDCSKAKNELGWVPVWKSTDTLISTAEWYKAFYQEDDVISEQQLEKYTEDAQNMGAVWAN